MADLRAPGFGTFAWIYHGPDAWYNDKLFINGNIIMITYERHYFSGGAVDTVDFTWWSLAYQQKENTGWEYSWDQSGPPQELCDRLVRVTSWNCDAYGLCHSGGSKYKLRYACNTMYEDGGYRRTLNAGDYVVFGTGQAYITSTPAGQGYYGAWDPNNGEGAVPLRMNGYIRNGVYTDTSREYIWLAVYAHPDNTDINPY